MATILNLNKAFHIDDVFHLEAAQWIEQHPLQPMSGKINWDDTSIAIYYYNQPPLYFYFIAIVGNLFGYNEIVLHLFQSLFTLCAIIFFYKIAEIVCPKHSILLTVLLVLNPAFLVNQNLMVDVPLLSLQLLFIYLLIKPAIRSAIVRYGLAAVVLSIALLIKYTTLPLVILLLLAPLIRKEPKYIIMSLLPVFVLGLWSLLNYWEYGAFHLLGRPKSIRPLQSYALQAISFVLCLGSIAPFTIAFISGVSKASQHLLRALVLLAVVTFISIPILWYFSFLSDKLTRHILWGWFMMNGLLALFFAIASNLRSNNTIRIFRENEVQLLILLWGVGLVAFLLLFAPFMATRHVLLVIPPILLLSVGFLQNVSFGMQALAVGLSVGLSLLLGISDWVSADFYRNQASKISEALPENATVYTVGHWGWQWYSKEAGMKQYDHASSKVTKDDYLIVPKRIPKQLIESKQHVVKVMKIVSPVNPFTYFSTAGDFASFYYSEHVLAP